jgi:hypothetical protein
MSQVLPNISRLRSMERAAAMDPARISATDDIPFSQLFSDWVDSNMGKWQPQQVPIANALMTINVQVREHAFGEWCAVEILGWGGGLDVKEARRHRAAALCLQQQQQQWSILLGW